MATCFLTLPLSTLLCVIWWYCLWAVCPCLSWSTFGFSWSRLGSIKSHAQPSRLPGVDGWAWDYMRLGPAIILVLCPDFTQLTWLREGHARDFCFSTCANLKSHSFNFNFRYMVIHIDSSITLLSIHKHVSCNADPLVWGSLRLASIIDTWTFHTQMSASYSLTCTMKPAHPHSH